MFGTVKFTVALCSCFILICQADKANNLHPPTNLSAKWIDHLTLRVSWSRPKDLPKDCVVHYDLMHNGNKIRTSETYFLDDPLTETQDKWKYSVRTFGVSSSCKEWRSSEEKLEVNAPKPRAEVKDFKCHLSDRDMNCSWIPNPELSRLSLSYRACGTKPELIKHFKHCDRTYLDGPRRVCHLKGNFLQTDLCMVASSPEALSTFRAPKALKLPKQMEILEEGSNLVLKLMPLQVQIPASIYNICYSVCDKMMCMEYQIVEEYKKIPYDKSCQYKFQYQARTSVYSTPIYSDWSEEIVYGSTDITLTVVAIVIPIIVSVCVILSCICFRRHKDIICPDVPDPSAIFKEMMNGNKEMKPKVHMYTPVQEPVEPITIVAHIPPVSGHVST